MADEGAIDPLARARAHVARDEFVDAERVAQREIRLDPYSAPAYIVLASALIGQGKREAARIAAERAIAIEPGLPAGHLALASAWLADNRPVEAEAAARRAVALDPASTDGHMILGNALKLRGATADAEHEFDQAIALDPPDPEGERIWNHWRAPVVIAVSIAAFLAYHALQVLGDRFTERTVASVLLAITAVLIVAVLIGLAVQRRRLARLSSTERLEIALESRRRRGQEGQYVAHIVVIAVFIGGLSAVTILFALGQRPSLQLAVGDCFSSDRRSGMAQIAAIPCQLPHDFEVFAALSEPSPPGTPFPGLEALGARLRPQCEQLYPGYVGVPFDRNAPTQIRTFVPEESYWVLDIRAMFCVLSDPGGAQLVGSYRRST